MSKAIVVPSDHVELPIIPMRRNEFIKKLVKEACVPWRSVMYSTTLPENKVKYLDALWAIMKNGSEEFDFVEPSPLDILDEFRSILTKTLPLDYQWKLYKTMLFDQFKGLSLYSTLMLNLESAYIRRNMTSYGYSQTMAIFHSLPNGSGEDWSNVGDEFERLSSMFNPFFMDKDNKFSITWEHSHTEDWLLENVLSYEKCPFYFSNDPLYLQVRLLSDQ